ncbi:MULTISPECIES: ABC transporter ATP-binding protein [unclassified Pseudoalteromonas]|uniref:ABC transporter ATP-binding protein n=1 Tax=unclassified Pseudoalteromonas TaxID=194690 RepID=UPI000C8F53F4|nr:MULTISPECIES: ABC transporter ATP-binding protein [unclassified Pseudoalteromonas]QLE07873.1 ABC transporter ATP-binding protein [Pseudoalteromonas shioyasakiensis]MAD02403.1 ABC transporter ATP-binding protein [Pseudoalteromonas sp.]MCP4588817.1 ABC transporter ATP-binding protein [Pseudoalteromonas sp.]QWV04539.1 ABC transporter ATP-binding protein [Pseudoalteromonas shioyasakiensis]RZD21314.1 ABC transporter ATP-binding protein [Pseudoalteromonas sp. MEBiC 03485]|tara:strand:+ start:43983 stop:44711 length:729 start_codon:yes stop_codon:yes gene_type:complete
MNTEILRVNNLTKSFTNGDQVSQILKGISFTVYDGEFISISGPSGCGKSTLLNIMGLLDTPQSGEYYIDGLLVSDMDSTQRSKVRGNRIGFVFQSFNLIDEMTILENVALPLKYRGDSLSTRHARALDCLEKVGLADKTDLYPNQISGGQQQRVSIARALAGDSGIMLVDEPTGNLDSKNGDAIMALIKDLNQQGTTIVLVTHDPRYANMASRNIQLKDGSVIAENDDINTPIEANRVAQPC